MRQVRINVQTLWLGVVVLALFVSAGVTLALAGWSGTAILGFLSALGAVVSVVFPLFDRLVELVRKQDAQTETLATIDRRVNGELDARIEAAVRQAMGGATVTVVGQPGPLPSSPPSDTLPT